VRADSAVALPKALNRRVREENPQSTQRKSTPADRDDFLGALCGSPQRSQRLKALVLLLP
jgi:hypothetical protein